MAATKGVNERPEGERVHELGVRSLLDDAARLYRVDVVDLGQEVQTVRYEQDGLAGVAELHDRIVEDSLADVRIEGAQGVVEELGRQSEHGVSALTNTSALKYSARAMLTRCFCPPERLMPFSPI